MNAVEWGDARVPAFVWAFVYPCPITGCWLWGGGLTTEDYATSRFEIAGSGRLVHRSIYFATFGAIEAGLELDHLCRVRWCVRPDDLEPVTHEENGRRGMAGTLTAARNRAKAAARTHFDCGHSIAEHARHRSDGGRQCATCNRTSQVGRDLARRGAA